MRLRNFEITKTTQVWIQQSAKEVGKVPPRRPKYCGQGRKRPEKAVLPQEERPPCERPLMDRKKASNGPKRPYYLKKKGPRVKGR